MRKIKIEKWKSKVPKYDEGKIVGTEDKDEDLLIAFNVLIANKKPEEMPRGLDKFRTFGRLSKAFEKADETGFLELEEADYKFLKDSIEKDVPASWGMNANIMKAMEEFLDAKAEE
uniref:Tail assembly chaperone n=1 Tax=viral metagenome TaxID=1070528 RepID=A0A6M3IQI8_9ZZZZ